MVGRLDDRAEEGDVVVRLALDYLAARYPDVVESTLDGEPTDPPKPTDVADVPPAVDDVVGKAMATEKLRRYETATQLRQELRRLVPEGGDGE